MNLLREYLEGQADLGGDEVVLPAAWVKPARTRETGRRPAESRPTQGNREETSLRQVMEALKQEAAPQDPPPGLAGPAAEAAAVFTAGLSSSPAYKSPEASSLPAFADFEAFWDYVGKNCESLHGFSAGIVKAAGPLFAPLVLVSLQPAQGGLLDEPARDLLEKMMRAIRLDLSALYITSLAKVALSSAGSKKTWSRRDWVRLVPLLHSELGLAKSRYTLLLGEACAQAVLKTGKGLEELRQTVHAVEGREFVATYHPSDLLQNQELKRKAWVDLQWLEKRLQQNP